MFHIWEGRLFFGTPNKLHCFWVILGITCGGPEDVAYKNNLAMVEVFKKYMCTTRRSCLGCVAQEPARSCAASVPIA